MSDEFLKALYKMSDGEYKIFERYKVAREIGMPNTQVDDIVDNLHNKGLVKKLERPKYF